MAERHVMVDLETMGTAPGSALLSIGAVHFDPAGPPLPPLADMPERHRFYQAIDLADAAASGLTIDAGTVMWWLRQEAGARAALTESKPLPLRTVLRMLNGWIENFCHPVPTGEPEPATLVLWGHGAAFDPVLLEATYRACGFTPPWSYKNIRDTRTLFALVGKPHIGNDHHALRDAWAQARAVQQAMERIIVQPAPMSRALIDLINSTRGDIFAERRRQAEREGFTTQHDDTYRAGELLAAAGCYIDNAQAVKRGGPGHLPGMAPTGWPWAPGWWKPKDYVRDMVRAGALVLAEIERRDRRRDDWSGIVDRLHLAEACIEAHLDNQAAAHG